MPTKIIATWEWLPAHYPYNQYHIDTQMWRPEDFWHRNSLFVLIMLCTSKLEMKRLTVD